MGAFNADLQRWQTERDAFLPTADVRLDFIEKRIYSDIPGNGIMARGGPCRHRVATRDRTYIRGFCQRALGFIFRGTE